MSKIRKNIKIIGLTSTIKKTIEIKISNIFLILNNSLRSYNTKNE